MLYALPAMLQEGEKPDADLRLGSARWDAENTAGSSDDWPKQI